MAPILVLRPEPGASRTAARAAAMGLSVHKLPLFEIRPVAWNPPDSAGFDALLLTSANAVRHAGPAIERYRNMMVHAVGEATARTAREAGFSHVEAGPGDIAGLLARLHPPLRLLHLSGVDYRDADAPGITITRVPVYEAHLLGRPAGLDAALAEKLVIIVHSPRAGARLAALVPDRGGYALAAISQAAAVAAGEGWARVAIAERPDDEALLEIAARLCEEQPSEKERVSDMTSEYLAAETPPKRPRPLRTALIVGVAAFALGLVAMGWIVTRWNGGVGYFGRGTVTEPAKTAANGALPLSTNPAVTGVTASTADLLAARVRELEMRLAQIDVRAQGAAGNAGRAEALLVAFAARRALDRGVPLGYLESQLRERFGETQPRAVAIILTAARQPVTLEELQIGLEELGPTLSGGGPEGNWWSSFQRELSGLVVVRRAGTPSPAPAERLRRARQKLGGGQVDAALAEVARMPGHDEAENWMEAARRYIEARRALDAIETAAILQPKPLAPDASAPIAAPQDATPTP